MFHKELKRLSKRRVAVIQLERSVALLEEQHDPVSSLTLAGAAEEILGMIASQKGHTTTVDDWSEYLGSIYDWAGKTRPTKTMLIRRHNQLRNELKHNDDGKNSWIEADFQMEAEDMILRAIKNYHKAFGSFPRSKRIREWFEFMTL